jgi:NADPH:quinone reductase-like Zn-dependent oxidoreductase
MENTGTDTAVAEETVIIPQEEKVKTGSSAGKMKAIRIHEYGGLDTLIYESAPIPKIGPDEVLIKVHAAGVNPVDWKIREGKMKDNIWYRFPIILGLDMSGIVMNAGSLVTRFKAGDAVFARPDISLIGCYAEYAVAKASDIAFAPISISLAQAAGVPLASQTAWMGLFDVGALKRDQKVLIHGASGGVGVFAVQLAKIAGAYVVATTSAPNKEFVKSLGADEVIDYHKEDFGVLRDFDLVFDTIGGDTQARSWQVLHKNGVLVSTVGINEKESVKEGKTGKSFMTVSNGARLQEIAGLVDKRMLRVFIEKKFPLTEVKAAHELSQSGRTRGKIVLTIAESPSH